MMHARVKVKRESEKWALVDGLTQHVRQTSESWKSTSDQEDETQRLLNYPCVEASAASLIAPRMTLSPSATPYPPKSTYILFILTVIVLVIGLVLREFGGLTNGRNVYVFNVLNTSTLSSFTNDSNDCAIDTIIFLTNIGIRLSEFNVYGTDLTAVSPATPIATEIENKNEFSSRALSQKQAEADKIDSIYCTPHTTFNCNTIGVGLREKNVAACVIDVILSENEFDYNVNVILIKILFVTIIGMHI